MAAPAARYPWEQAEYEVGGESDSDFELPEAEQAATNMLEVLAELYFQSRISALTLCTICHWATKAGISHKQMESYAKPPGLSTGNYQKHLTKAMGMDESIKKQHRVVMPGCSRNQLGRCDIVMPMRSPHGLLDDEFKNDTSLNYKSQEMADSGQLPPAYHEHPIVQEADAAPCPIAMYSDAVPYTNTDSVVGIWLINLTSGARHVIALIRKSVVCRCGCKGWCTFWPVLQFVHWGLKALALGLHPCTLWDGSDPKPGSSLAKLAGKPLRTRAALIHCRGDWAEFCERFGYMGPTSVTRPCFCCNGFDDSRFEPSCVSVIDCPWEDTSEEQFEAALSEAEIKVTLTKEHHDFLKLALKYDKRNTGYRGRILTKSYEPLGL